MNKKISLSIITALSLTTLNAYEMKPIGFKATGMGGTGVASTRGSLSGYYNPALLRFSDYTTEISINAGVRLREANLIDNMDQLYDIDFDGTINRIGDNTATGKKKYSINGEVVDSTAVGTSNTQTDRDNLTTSIDILTNKIGANNAAQFSAAASFSAQMSDAVAIGIYANADMALRLNIDPSYNRLITKNTESISGQNVDVYFEYDPTTDHYTGYTDKTAYESSSLEYANDNGINYIKVDAMLLTEVPISYARAYDWNSGTWSFGVNLKPMRLITSTQNANLGEDSDIVGDDNDDFETTYKSTIGLDLGVAYIPKGYDMTIGLVGKNINSPKFKVDSTTTGASDYTIDPYFRAGVSTSVWNDNIEFALDMDLQKSDSLVKGEETQFIGAGVELHPTSWFAFRLGAMQDIASEKFDDGTILTTGLGFGTKWLQVDISAMASTETGEYDGNEIPRYTALNLAFISKWGEGYNRKTPPTSIKEVESKSEDISTDKKEEIQKKSEEVQKELSNEVKEV